jgi:hypothetical protein
VRAAQISEDPVRSFSKVRRPVLHTHGMVQFPPSEDGATLVHELAHEMIHKTEPRELISKTVKETEAEPVAFAVEKDIGLETGATPADYIQLYRGGAKLLQESLEVVQRTAAVILGAITPEMTGPRSPRRRQSAGAAVRTVRSRSPIRIAARFVQSAVAFWLIQESIRGLSTRQVSFRPAKSTPDERSRILTFLRGIRHGD